VWRRFRFEGPLLSFFFFFFLHFNFMIIDFYDDDDDVVDISVIEFLLLLAMKHRH
jgi:hypothetical protein